MPSVLQIQVQKLAETLAHGILEAIRNASLEELAAGSYVGTARAAAPRAPGRAKAAPGRPRSVQPVTRPAPEASRAPAAAKKPAGKGGRLARRSPSDLEHVVGMITKALSDAGKGMRAEELRSALKIDRREIMRPLAVGLDSGKLKKKGEKRATTYFLA
jgi:hypothetical protein